MLWREGEDRVCEGEREGEDRVCEGERGTGQGV